VVIILKSGYTSSMGIIALDQSRRLSSSGRVFPPTCISLFTRSCIRYITTDFQLSDPVSSQCGFVSDYNGNNALFSNLDDSKQTSN